MRILLIEDDQMLGEAVREHVAAAGHGVDWMKRIDEAREAFVTVPYELLLLDLNLPDGRGLDFLRELRRNGSKVPVIVLTAMDQIASRIEGLNSGADDYLVKPFDLSELSARVAAVARRYRPLPRCPSQFHPNGAHVTVTAPRGCGGCIRGSGSTELCQSSQSPCATGADRWTGLRAAAARPRTRARTSWR